MVSVLVAIAGIYLAYRFYVAAPGIADRLAERLRAAYGLLLNKYYVDETYDALIVHPVADGSRRVLWMGVDVGIIDGAVNGAGRLVQGSASMLKHMQNGLARNYAAWILAGAVLILIYVYMFRG